MKESTQLLTTIELKEKVNISLPTIRKMAHNGELPFIWVGNHMRFYWPAVEEALRGKTSEARK